MKDQSIEEMFKHFFSLPIQYRGELTDEDFKFLKELASNPDLSLKAIDKAIKINNGLTYAQFRWIFCNLSLKMQLELVKEVAESATNDQGNPDSYFKRAILKYLEERIIFGWLNVNEHTALSCIQEQIQRGFLFSNYKEREYNYPQEKMYLITTLFFEAAITDGHPIKIFFDAIDKKYGQEFFWPEYNGPKPWLAPGRI